MHLQHWREFKIILLVAFLVLNAPRQIALCRSTVDTSSVFGADSKTAIKIIDIEVLGNKKTRNYIITRELKLKPGSYATADDIEMECKRIQNLRLFTRVEVSSMHQDDGIILIFIVTEKLYIFPYPLFFRNERSWKKLSYGAGLSYYNFRGRNESLNGEFWAGYNPTLTFAYKNPWFGGNSKLYARFDIYKGTFQNNSLNIESFKEKRTGTGLTLGKRFGFHTYFDFGMSYIELKTTAKQAVYTLNASGIDRWLTYRLQFRVDTRDLYEYPHKGVNLQLYAQKSGHENSAINFSFYGFDFRSYLPLARRWTLALRSAVDLSRGRIPVYSHLFLGYSERIRGYFYDQAEGENRVIGGAGIRFPLTKITYHTFFQDTPFRDYYRNLKFGISGEFFVDTGMVWMQQSEFNARNLMTGYGAGIHFHLSYIDVLRLEYGISDSGAGQWILFDVGVPF
ncbi:hypothetical protein JXJ21_26310 [candidate division KSB1 bacterium]|nr:hypothetical protein [candidate division KSB1 bacterium]